MQDALDARQRQSITALTNAEYHIIAVLRAGAGFGFGEGLIYLIYVRVCIQGHPTSLVMRIR